MTVEERRKKQQRKKKSRHIFRTIVLAVLLVAVVFALVTNFTKDNEIYKSGDIAPNFALKQISKNNDTDIINLESLRGKGVMLNFWATYCEPCEAEMPFMESLYPKYKDDIEIVAVSLDMNDLVIHRFIDKYNLTFPVVHDKKSKVMDQYKVGQLPSTFFIDPEGKIVNKVSGALTLDQLEGHFNEILPN